MPLSRFRPWLVLSFQYAKGVDGDYITPSRDNPVGSGYKVTSYLFGRGSGGKI
jgi:hypothetical protein